jgi:hypothetical protein
MLAEVTTVRADVTISTVMIFFAATIEGPYPEATLTASTIKPATPGGCQGESGRTAIL